MLLSQLQSSQAWILPPRVPRLGRVSTPNSKRISMTGQFWWIKYSAIHARSSILQNGIDHLNHKNITPTATASAFCDGISAA
uniref:Uncharacterized protein n=1 Tax=Quercus lobata TaxID=97700 RepID=A0A7N2LVN3_QUELO